MGVYVVEREQGKRPTGSSDGVVRGVRDRVDGVVAVQNVVGQDFSKESGLRDVYDDVKE